MTYPFVRIGTHTTVTIGQATIELLAEPPPPGRFGPDGQYTNPSERNKAGSISLDWNADDVLHAATRVLGSVIGDPDLMALLNRDLSHARLTIQAKNGHCGPTCEETGSHGEHRQTCATYWGHRRP